MSTFSEECQLKTKGIDLAHDWSLWVDIQPALGFDDANHKFSQLGSFGNIRSFWRYFNNINYILTRLPSMSNLRLFKSSFGPAWEYSSDITGGFWIIDLSKNNYQEFWLNFAMIVVGEVFDDSHKVMGIVLALRESYYHIQLWVSSIERIPAIESQLKSFLGMLDDSYIAFQQVNPAKDLCIRLSKNHISTEYDREFVESIRSQAVEPNLKYDGAFLRRFSLSETCHGIPKEYDQFDWDALAREAEQANGNSGGILNRINTRRSSWPNVIQPPPTWKSGKRVSLDETTLFSQLQGLAFHSNSFLSPGFCEFGANNISRIWEFDEQDSETKEDPTGVIEQLSSFKNNFSISVTGKLSQMQENVLNQERCPLCLEGNLVEKEVLYSVFSCKLLDCHHILHVTCVMKHIGRIDDLLMKNHTTSFFKCIPSKPTDFGLVSSDPPGIRTRCSVNLRICHVIGTVAVLNVDWPHTISSLLDQSCGREYLLLTLEVTGNSLLRISRGRITFKCSDMSSNQNWEHDCNFDLTESTAEFLKLILIDSSSQNSLELGVKRVPNSSGFFITNLKYKFGLSERKGSYSEIVTGSHDQKLGLFHQRLSEDLSIIDSKKSLVKEHSIWEKSEDESLPKTERKQGIPIPTWDNLSPSNWNIEARNNSPECEKISHSGDDEGFFSFEFPAATESDSVAFDTNNLPELKSLSGKLIAVAKTQAGSRYIQDHLEQQDLEEYKFIFSELANGICELMADNFGHYAIQKLIESANDKEKMLLVQSMTSNISNVACHKQGSFSLQAMMDHISNPEQIEILGDSLKKNLTRVIMNASGHYVVLKFLQTYPYPHFRFIHEVIEKNCSALACDHYGLRIMKAVIDTGPLVELNGIFKKVARATMKIVENQYGNYIVQQVLDIAPQSIRNSIKMKMEGKFVRLAKQKFSSNVVEKCLQNSNAEWRSIIIKELCSAAAKLIRDRYGNYVLQTALSVADPSLAKEMSKALTPHLGTLRENVKQKWISILESTAEKYGNPKFHS